jgi:hypothetical protein
MNRLIKLRGGVRSEHRCGMDRYIHVQPGRIVRIADEAA